MNDFPIFPQVLYIVSALLSIVKFHVLSFSVVEIDVQYTLWSDLENYRQFLDLKI